MSRVFKLTEVYPDWLIYVNRSGRSKGIIRVAITLPGPSYVSAIPSNGFLGARFKFKLADAEQKTLSFLKAAIFTSNKGVESMMYFYPDFGRPGGRSAKFLHYAGAVEMAIKAAYNEFFPMMHLAHEFGDPTVLRTQYASPSLVLRKNRLGSRSGKASKMQLWMSLPIELKLLVIDEAILGVVETSTDPATGTGLTRCKPLNLIFANGFFLENVVDRFCKLMDGRLAPCQLARVWKYVSGSKLTERELLDRLPYKHNMPTHRRDSFDRDGSVICLCGRETMSVTGLPEELGL